MLCLFTGTNGTDAQELPQLTPPSPTAYELTKYGEIPVNESTGMVNINIPLFEYNAGRLSVPVSLGYTSDGVKVDQVATWVGMGWNLHAGGVITRQVKGVADELAYTRVFTDLTTVENLRSDASGFTYFIRDLLDDTIDYEPDIYSFSIGGISGSFYIDQNSNAILIKNEHEIKVEVDGLGFIVKTTDGKRYYFDGTGENAKSDAMVGSGPGGISNFTQTSWYLTKMDNHFGDEIYFTYAYTASYVYTTGFDQTIRVKNSCPSGLESITTCYVSQQNTRKISEISSNRNGAKIVFNAAKQRSDLPGEYILNSIDQKNGNDLVKRYNLYYDNVESTESYYGAANHAWLNYPNHFFRHFLIHVKETDNNGNELNGRVHSFEYDDPTGLPPRLSFSQDLLGYYNGKLNMGYIPINTGDQLDLYSLNGYARGDRSADFNYAKKGSMTKVTYPTKGYTELEYEPILNLETTTSTLTSTFVMDVNNLNQVDYFVQEFNSLYEQPLNINVDLTILEGDDYIHDRAIITIRDKVTSAVLLSENIDQNSTSLPLVYVEANTVYEVIISLQPVIMDDVQVELDFSYKSGEVTQESPINKSGLRIKRIKSKAALNSDEEIVRYYYAAKEDLNSSTLLLVSEFEFIEDLGASAPSPYCIVPLYAIKSTSLNHYYQVMPQRFAYAKVTKSYGENFENGGTEKHFESIIPPLNTVVWGNTIPNSGLSNYAELHNGRLNKEIHFSMENGAAQVKSEKRYVYKETGTFIDAFAGRRRFLNFGSLPGETTYSLGVDVERYKLYSQWNSIDSIISTDHLNGLEVTTTESYVYGGNLAGHPTEIIKRNSRGETLKTKNTYPTSGTLFNEYRIAEILKSENFKDNDPLSTQTTEFSNFGSLYLPSNVKTLKGEESIDNAEENRIVYHQYDGYGNPMDISKAGGPHIYYVWGYQGQYPIAKIENFDSSQASAIQATRIDPAVTASNNDSSEAAEDTLRAKLEDLRNDPALSNALITTFTYDPLIGVTSITDTKGVTTYYGYDNFNRLENSRDNNEKLLMEHIYHYKD
ncbi:hypothetical protein D2V93_06975 [Flagellimonas taeanensis]|uniref:hypothetical protein n=1 Tax=Flavobacteriaceae TaxID=49546 RepID=UPI000E67FDDE|nr:MULTISPECIES: hypothetical protein [Allomuricauda]MDC6384615.1 hypothetical protein [Muricauda sp. SK9]RIV51641.1 hypothetical protein D2V93_06975 [Allomuricauda taeanensis]